GFEFEDISATAGINEHKLWAAGVTMADVNGDGWLDIYVCQAGASEDPAHRQNLLYINEGAGQGGHVTFSEKAAEYGLNDGNRSTQAAFFDYDKDGDLDCFVMNESKYYHVVYAVVFEALKDKNNLLEASSNLFRNDNGHFVKVTEEAGLLRYGFGLGLAISDMNEDGWPDIYQANDYSVPDFLYINNGDGTFTDKMKQMTRHTVFSGMGCDIADINNDGLPDIAVLDMPPNDHVRNNTIMEIMDGEAFHYYVEQLGYPVQYMFNCLQLNNGNGTYSEIAGLAGVMRTDWSWSALFADFDLDGYKDYYVTNGFRRYAMDGDFRRSLAIRREAHNGTVPNEYRKDLYEMMPQIKLPNVAYRNNHDLTFTDMAKAWGLAKPAYSYGAAYADLDADGDLDLVVNNIDDKAFVYRNNAAELKRGNFLEVKLRGKWTACAKVNIRYGGARQMGELMNTRGYASAVEELIHFGLGQVESVDTLEVLWPDGRVTRMQDVAANQILVIDDSGAEPMERMTPPPANTPFQKVEPPSIGVDFAHKENAFDDFSQQILLPHKQSRLGPQIGVADVNGDGLEDFFIGGAAYQPGALYLQNTDATFSPAESQPWQIDALCEDMDPLFFDADGNGVPDLYLVSGGGGEFQDDPAHLQDRLYVSPGGGKYFKVKNALPEMLQSTNCVKAADFDRDGDLDLFIGGAAVPGRYPYPCRSYILKNDHFKFIDVTQEIAPALMAPGIVKDAVWTDINNDDWPDLVLAGEWMPIEIFINENGKLRGASEQYGTAGLTGWWQSIAVADVDADGDPDLIAGNVGLNTKFEASEQEPFHIFANDFDKNGTNDIVLSTYYKGKLVPVKGLEYSVKQMPFLERKILSYNDFAHASLDEIYGREALDNALHLQAATFESVVLINEGQSFTPRSLPIEAQISPINGIIPYDFDADGKMDLLVAGNMYGTEVETPRHDAGNGLILMGTGGGNFQPLTIRQSGFFAPGNVKDVQLLSLGGGKGHLVLVANNDGPLEIFRFQDAEMLSSR
ncbi:MAG: VCBS repeat-containing protein, partial [Saprospiraceae bacterium]